VHEDHQRGTRHLVMSVSLPVSCSPLDADRLLVKANSSGTRLRVVSEQTPQRGRRRADEDHEELNEQFTLPVTVDPHRVTARLERNGVLVIEAPVAVF